MKKLKIEDIKVGEGDEAKKGKIIQVHYTGWIYDKKAKEMKGKKFDSSKDRGKPFEFPLGLGMVIEGWEKGFTGMKVGGIRKLTIPSTMAYGEREVGNVIPANSTLIFEVELLNIK